MIDYDTEPVYVFICRPREVDYSMWVDELDDDFGDYNDYPNL